MLCAQLVIYVIADHGIEFTSFADDLFQDLNDLNVGVISKKIIAVTDLIVQTSRFPKSCIDSAAVAFVFLMDSPDNARISPLIVLRDFKCGILRPIIYDENFYIFTADKSVINRLFHIGFGIIARYRDC